MNREFQPCGACAKFLPNVGQKVGAEGPGHCEGFDRPAHSTDRPCVLFSERDSWATRRSVQPPRWD